MKSLLKIAFFCLIFCGIIGFGCARKTLSGKEERITRTENQSADKFPEFPGGDEAIEKYFDNALAKATIPESRYLTINVTIDAKGKVKAAELTEPFRTIYAHENLNLKEVEAAIINTALNMPAWKPGIRNGKPAETQTTFPVFVYPEKYKENVMSHRQKTYDYVEQMPIFTSGEYDLPGYFKNTINLPEGKETTSGLVVVRFIVNRFGRIEKPAIVKSLDPELDQKVLRAVNSMPRWTPGKQNGIPVSTFYTVPVRLEGLK